MSKSFANTITRLAVAAGLAGCAALAASPAHASLEIQLQSGGSTWSDSGGSPLSISKTSVGSFAFSGDIGVAGPGPSLDLSSVNLSSFGGGSLTITLSENDLTSPIGMSNFLTQFSGNSAFGSIDMSLQTYVDDSNTLLGTGSLLASLSSKSTPFGVSSVDAGTTASPFALTEVLTVNAKGLSLTSLDSSITEVPEPASLALLGSALFGIGMVRRRRGSRLV